MLSLIGHGRHPATGHTSAPADRFGDVPGPAGRAGASAWTRSRTVNGPPDRSSPPVPVGALARPNLPRPPAGRGHRPLRPGPGPGRGGPRHPRPAPAPDRAPAVGKGADAHPPRPLRPGGGTAWGLQREEDALSRRLRPGEHVGRPGESRAPLNDVATVPRPSAAPPRVRHGSATVPRPRVAALHGDPLFTADALRREGRTRP
ncbi:hypothetical protein Srut_31220 [Streptomyces rutgersensis]|nr:hypothetical protein Srut_31220 [Streptomyces rutgersensis]